ncbi:MAG: enoyl-CoA hydratase/isomerase family protein, partial [Chloroflexota bacterium]|nr:enoyl-CoA hydratase/isomerase family protein [Chloroflexota bacterium]
PGQRMCRRRYRLRHGAGTRRSVIPEQATSSYIRLEIIEPSLAELVLDQPGSQVNLLNEAFVKEMSVCLDEVDRTPSIRALVVRSGKPGQFLAGADLDLLRHTSGADQLREFALQFQAVLNRLAELPATTVAAIGGSALGGGLELALACDYRVCVDDGGIQLGQSEVALGLIPAGGGAQRLPRLVGLPAGLDLILTGKRIPPYRARKIGLLDELVTEGALLAAARRLAAQAKRRAGRGAGFRRRAIEQTGVGRSLVFRQARRQLAKAGSHYPAPWRALEAVEVGFARGQAAGFQAEAQAFGELAAGPVSRNLVRLFFLTRAARRDPPAAEARPVRKIAIVGAGFMGAGIAETAALHGFEVRLRDVDQGSVARGLASVNQLLDGAARTGRWSRREVDSMRARVTATVAYEGFGSAELIIEAAFEELELKRRILTEIEQRASARAVIASNTSAIPISSIAVSAGRPGQVVGMHFFSPVHRMQLVEVVRPPRAEDWAVDTVVAAARNLGKTVIVVNDGPGFYTSRVVGQMMNEAALLFEGGASPADIDAAMVDFGFPVGPIALMDEVGLDVAAHAGAFLAQHLAGSMQPNSAVSRLAAAGRKGRKGGLGFYSYAQGKRQPDAGLAGVFPERTPRSIQRIDIQERISLAFVVEAMRCLAEGILRSPGSGDLGAVLGLGFPAFLGGPFRYVQTLGMPAVRDRLKKLAERHGPRFSPPETLLPAAFYAD